MNIFLTFVMSCPICGTHLNWLPVVKEDDPHLIEHQRLVGTEYCKYYGKIFRAPTIELEEVKPLVSAAAAASEEKQDG